MVFPQPGYHRLFGLIHNVKAGSQEDDRRNPGRDKDDGSGV
jgi:hypothetical protein